jgi:hypothetical protein
MNIMDGIVDMHKETTIERLQEYVKNNSRASLPQLYYWSGTQSFSDQIGRYRASTLAESIDLFLDDVSKDAAS